MSSLGEQLRARREKKGITLDQAAADTRIREKFLKALEDGDYRSLPGSVYTKGFLRNYADYLDLDQEDLVALFNQERGVVTTESSSKSYKPMRPIMRRSLIFTPAVLVPVVVLAGILLFVFYLYNEFATFAAQPPLEVTEPAGDAIVPDALFVLRGKTAPSGQVSVQIGPALATISDVVVASDGTFSVPIRLAQGANTVTVEVLDHGKLNRATRKITLPLEPATSAAPAKLIVDSPANGARFENTSVVVSGTTDGAVTVNGAAVPSNATSGRFETRLVFPAGQQSVTIVSRTASGASVTETRTVTVAYTAAVVQVAVKGGEAWLQATVDGTVVPGTGRVYKDGETATFSGKQVSLRTGNAAVTLVTYNGVSQGALGTQGQVVEKTFTVQ